MIAMIVLGLAIIGYALLTGGAMLAEAHIRPAPQAPEPDEHAAWWQSPPPPPDAHG